MKLFFFLFIAFMSMPVIAQSTESEKQPLTNIIDNHGDKLYSIIYPNSGKANIMLLHGGPGFSGDLSVVIEILQVDFQVITFQQRGTANSPCKSKDYSMTAYLSDIDSVAAFYGVAKFHLWGHSWGGLYAQIYAEKHPENLLSLFLCCPGPGTNGEWKLSIKESIQLNKSKFTFWQLPEMSLDYLLGLLGSDAAYKRLFKTVMGTYYHDFVTTGTFEINLDNLKAAPINKTRPQIVKYPLLKKQENPGYQVTIVYGDKDIYRTSKNYVINRYPTAKVWTIKNCGHIPSLFNPTDYTTILKQHFE
jgi:proline iminopeptidase